MGLLIGHMYSSFMKTNTAFLPFKKAFVFGIVIFGPFWMIYTIFAPALFDMLWVPAIIRALLDILYIMIGVLITEKLAPIIYISKGE